MCRQTDGVLCELVFTVCSLSSPFSFMWVRPACPCILGKCASAQGLQQAVFCTITNTYFSTHVTRELSGQMEREEMLGCLPSILALEQLRPIIKG